MYSATSSTFIFITVSVLQLLIVLLFIWKQISDNFVVFWKLIPVTSVESKGKKKSLVNFIHVILIKNIFSAPCFQKTKYSYIS